MVTVVIVGPPEPKNARMRRIRLSAPDVPFTSGVTSVRKFRLATVVFSSAGLHFTLDNSSHFRHVRRMRLANMSRRVLLACVSASGSGYFGRASFCRETRKAEFCEGGWTLPSPPPAKMTPDEVSRQHEALPVFFHSCPHGDLHVFLTPCIAAAASPCVVSGLMLFQTLCRGAPLHKNTEGIL